MSIEMEEHKGKTRKLILGYVVGAITGLLGGITSFGLPYWLTNFGLTWSDSEFSFGVTFIFWLLPVISPVAGVLSIFLVNLLWKKDKPNYLRICAIVGFLAGFLPFRYYFMS